MSSVNKGLGRGLGALFNDIPDVEEVTKKKKDDKSIDKVVELRISEVEPMLNQPRKVFNQGRLQELADSIEQHGIIQPILVVKNENGYSIVAGERRWRAAKLVGVEKIPAIVKDYTDSKKKQVALIENIQREDLNIIEVAQALKELMEIEGYSVADVSKVTGKSSPAVSNTLRLLKLPNKIQDYLLDGKLVEGQARALLAIEDDEQEQLKIAEKIINDKLSVRQVEAIIYSDNKYKVKKKKVKKASPVIYRKIEEKLTEYFGVRVQVDASRSKQRICIEYINQDGLESVLEKLKIRL